MEDSKKTSEDEEAESNSSVKLVTYILCFAGITSITSYWIFIPDLALYLTLFEIPLIGFFILALKKKKTMKILTRKMETRAIKVKNRIKKKEEKRKSRFQQ